MYGLASEGKDLSDEVKDKNHILRLLEVLSCKG